ncbi:MAG: exodeoxyribonuclease VII small subunit [Chloroflexota bacterium]|nr:exodeoxyribonuclease VII small subunit [Chloroflexota bacterium]
MTQPADKTSLPEPDGAPASGTFGATMDQLETIVAHLEGDEALGLEEALALYERGVDLAGECRRRLGAAQLKLSEIPVAPVGAVDADIEDSNDSPPLGGSSTRRNPAYRTAGETP